MPQSGGATISDNNLIYSIQQTYIINLVPKSNTFALTCNQRIDVPVIEPVTNVQAVVYDVPRTVVPCVELKMTSVSLEGVNFVFETNEGETVLPVKIYSGMKVSWENPYSDERWVLALPRGTTGIKSCKVLFGKNGDTIQHNFTFGIMPPPYNYDNALFGVITSTVSVLGKRVEAFGEKVGRLKLKTDPTLSAPITLPKNEGKQTIDLEDWELFFDTRFSYTSSPEPTIHKPKITLHGYGGDRVYTLSLNKTINTVSIDLFTYMLTVYDDITGEIMEQFKIDRIYGGFDTLSFENFDDIEYDDLRVTARGASVNE